MSSIEFPTSFQTIYSINYGFTHWFYLGDDGLGFDSRRARASQILLANVLPIDSITVRNSDLQPKTEVLDGISHANIHDSECANLSSGKTQPS